MDKTSMLHLVFSTVSIQRPSSPTLLLHYQVVVLLNMAWFCLHEYESAVKAIFQFGGLLNHQNSPIFASACLCATKLNLLQWIILTYVVIKSVQQISFTTFSKASLFIIYNTLSKHTGHVNRENYSTIKNNTSFKHKHNRNYESIQRMQRVHTTGRQFAVD